ncbi:PaaI family thioesterase [Sulfitobacter sp. D35]|uniref:PaaI family thioesterase n=1 Tax=Sulfitobacter sp. D35 TaxID=3083252 RepID=UPI00296E7CA7|nr:PaaI family thioesterase [Sulfitobacter sp. D35]MDW4499548.1 PaaI family thioesterase [Sulfitobacter sp. D35]
MTETLTPETAQAFLEANFAPWIRALELRIAQIDAERTVLEMPITDEINRTGGIVSGQALAALADTAMVFGCCGHLGEMHPVGTVTLDTQFLRPASGAALRAEAEVTRAGRSMIFARCAIREEPSGKTVAPATATFAR